MDYKKVDAEQAMIDYIFGNGPNPAQATVPPDRVIREWIWSTEAAIAALRRWLDHLRDWQGRNGRELAPGDFDAAFRALCQELGDGWADSNPAGGGIDRLAEVVTRE